MLSANDCNPYRFQNDDFGQNMLGDKIIPTKSCKRMDYWNKLPLALWVYLNPISIDFKSKLLNQIIGMVRGFYTEKSFLEIFCFLTNECYIVDYTNITKAC